MVSPNHCTPSCTILQEKGYTPLVIGAVAVKVNVIVLLIATGELGSSTRLKPQVVLSWASCEPSLYASAPVLVQTVAPLLLKVIEAVNMLPVVTPLGTTLPTNFAPAPNPV